MKTYPLKKAKSCYLDRSAAYVAVRIGRGLVPLCGDCLTHRPWRELVVERKAAEQARRGGPPRGAAR